MRERRKANPLREAILGLLSIRPMSGYDVARSYKRALERVWQAPIGQIYPTLRAMEREGVLEFTVEIQENRPNRKVYRLGPRGKQEFERWIAELPELPRVHHEFIHKLLLLDHVAPERRQALVEDYAQRCRAWVKDLIAVDKKMRPALEGPYAESVYHQLLAIAHLRNVVEAEAKSAEVIARQYLSNSAHSNSKGRRRRTKSEAGIPDVFGGLPVSPEQEGSGKVGVH